jgi:DNA-directed RNA polymerase subunit RPC12/RpoP
VKRACYFNNEKFYTLTAFCRLIFGDYYRCDKEAVMSAEIECRKCSNDLEQWNNGRGLRINYCPYCGTRLLEEQSEALHRKTTVEEISDMIRGHLFDMFSDRDGMEVSAEDLGYLAWESENCDGVVLYSNYEADLFAMRHTDWVDGAFEYVCDNFGEAEHYAKMKAECNDRFLVIAFIYATEHYVFDQLGIDRDEGGLTKERIEEIKRLIKTVSYDGQF